MKELTIEQKAQAYDKALEKARQLCAYPTTKPFISDLQDIFPELKESEDEQYKKWILEYLYDGLRKSDEQFKSQFKDAIDWLEKQGEQKPKGKSALEAIKEEKVDNANKIEPKFHEDDWTVSNLDGKTRRISEVHFDEYNSYYVVDGKSVNLEEYDRLHHLWTIEDARDGDVLSDGTTIFIFQDLLSDGSVMSYCDYDTDSSESDALCPFLMNYMCSKITPATKEQYDTLMKAMANKGYTFDFEKKELELAEA